MVESGARFCRCKGLYTQSTHLLFMTTHKLELKQKRPAEHVQLHSADKVSLNDLDVELDPCLSKMLWSVYKAGSWMTKKEKMISYRLDWKCLTWNSWLTEVTKLTPCLCSLNIKDRLCFGYHDVQPYIICYTFTMQIYMTLTCSFNELLFVTSAYLLCIFPLVM